MFCRRHATYRPAAPPIRGAASLQLLKFFEPTWSGGGPCFGLSLLLIKLITPILNGVLASPGTGFTTKEIQKLGRVKWQTQLLAHEARLMKDMLMLTFTVGEHNHERVVYNHATGMRTYRMRTEYTLDAVREALKELQP